MANRATWALLVAWLVVAAAFAWPIARANANIAANGDKDSASPTVQADWLQFALATGGPKRDERLIRILGALDDNREKDVASARVYISAEGHSARGRCNPHISAVAILKIRGSALGLGLCIAPAFDPSRRRPSIA